MSVLLNVASTLCTYMGGAREVFEAQLQYNPLNVITFGAITFV